MQETFSLRRKLIFVLGSQRSGTTAMLQALGQDPAVQAENESPNNELYDNYRLRPEPTIRSILWNYRRRIILKPVADVDFEPVEEIVGEFKDYDPQVVWLYRDPVNVWSSAKSTFDLPADVLDEWIHRWRVGNESLLAALQGPLSSRFLVVRYEDLIEQRLLFDEVCSFLGIEPRNNLFWKEDRRTGRKGLPGEVQRTISDRTADILARLDEKRHRLTRAPKVERSQVITAGSSWTVDGNSPSETSADADRVFSLLATDHPFRLHYLLPAAPPAEGRLATFWIRSSQWQRGSALISRQAPPWEVLGASQAITVDRDWRHVSLPIPDSIDLSLCRVHLEFPPFDGDIEVSPVRVGTMLGEVFELLTHQRAQAKLRRLPDHPSGTAIDLVPKGSTQDSDVQLVLGRGNFQKGKCYRLRIRLRAETTGGIGIALSESSTPWGLLAEYRRVFVTQEATSFVLEFHPHRDSPGRIYLDVSSTLKSVEIFESTLEVSEDSLGQIITQANARGWIEPSEEPDLIRIIPRPTGARSHIDVQWEKGIGPVGAGIRYSLTLRVRADGTRPFGFGLSEADDPWTPLDLYYYETATRAWREFYFEVVPDRDYPRVRILVDAGASDIPLEIGLALVQPVSDRITDAEKARLHRYMDAIGTGFPSPSHPGPSR